MYIELQTYILIYSVYTVCIYRLNTDKEVFNLYKPYKHTMHYVHIASYHIATCCHLSIGHRVDKCYVVICWASYSRALHYLEPSLV